MTHQETTSYEFIPPKKPLPFANKARGLVLTACAVFSGIAFVIVMSVAESAGPKWAIGVVAVLALGFRQQHIEQTKQIEDHNRMVDEQVLRTANRRDEEARVARERERRIREAYGDKASLVLAGKLWIDCPESAVLEMFGAPESRDEKVSRDSVSQTLKYFPSGKNRYGLRVEITNGRVSGWEDKRSG